MNFLQRFAKHYYKQDHNIKSDDYVADFYSQVDDPFELKAKLALMSFHWNGKLSFFDWNKTPAESLASHTRMLSCGDLMGCYVELYKKLGLHYECYLLQSNHMLFWSRTWRYISIFRFKDDLWLQSKNSLTEIQNLAEVLTLFPEYSKAIYQP